MTSPAFATALTARLAAEGLSLRAASAVLGVTAEAIRHWTSGSSVPSPAAAARLRAALPGLDVPQRRMGRPRLVDGGAA